MMLSSCSFDVYGFRFAVQGTAEEALKGIEQDFAFFSSDAPAAIKIDLIEEDPPVDGLPLSDAIVYTPRNVTYRRGHLRYIDYHGRALGIQDTNTGSYKLYARDSNLLYEATYLYLLSQIGRALDSRGLHRMHALGITIKERAVLVLLPMGGGKSTLGLQLLKNPDVQLLSDDSPFIDRKGNALAFPLRLGLLPGSENAVPAEHRRVIDRMEFGPKHLVNYSYFKNRVQPSAAPGIVFIGARTLAPTCRIEPAGVGMALKACVANCVVGVGLFQGLEFILRASPFELCKNSLVGASRLRNCIELLRRSRAVCQIHLGRNSQLNAETLIDYANAHLPRPAEDAPSVLSRACQ
ncbi:MAG: hypothetical protein JO051_17710 [Acidobacteriaceae bacterium]|nr:hypothetical protein [Acidobacteriaceae bacterium]